MPGWTILTKLISPPLEGVAVVVLATYLQNEIKYPEHKRTTQTAVPKVFDV